MSVMSNGGIRDAGAGVDMVEYASDPIGILKRGREGGQRDPESHGKTWHVRLYRDRGQRIIQRVVEGPID